MDSLVHAVHSGMSITDYMQRIADAGSVGEHSKPPQVTYVSTATEDALDSDFGIDAREYTLQLLEMYVRHPRRTAAPVPDLLALLRRREVPRVDESRGMQLVQLQTDIQKTWKDTHEQYYYALLYMAHARDLDEHEKNEYYDVLEEWDDLDRGTASLWHQLLRWWQVRQQRLYERSERHKYMREGELRVCGDDEEMQEMLLMLQAELRGANFKQYDRLLHMLENAEIDREEMRTEWRRCTTMHRTLPSKPTNLMCAQLDHAIQKKTLETEALAVLSPEIRAYTNALIACGDGSSSSSSSEPTIRDMQSRRDDVRDEARQRLWTALLQLRAAHCESAPLVLLLDRCRMDFSSFIKYTVQLVNGVTIRQRNSPTQAFARDMSETYAGQWRDYHNLSDATQRERYFVLVFVLHQNMYTKLRQQVLTVTKAAETVTRTETYDAVLYRAFVMAGCMARMSRLCKRVYTWYLEEVCSRRLYKRIVSMDDGVHEAQLCLLYAIFVRERTLGVISQSYDVELPVDTRDHAAHERLVNTQAMVFTWDEERLARQRAALFAHVVLLMTTADIDRLENDSGKGYLRQYLDAIACAKTAAKARGDVQAGTEHTPKTL